MVTDTPPTASRRRSMSRRSVLKLGGAAIAGNAQFPTGNYPNSVFQQLIADFVPRKPRQIGLRATYSF